MEVILLDKVPNVGDLGEIKKVKDGYARNFLIPSGRARNRASVCWAPAPRKYESRSVVPRAIVLTSIPNVSWRSGPTYEYEWSIAVVP